jgi:hypothetical protein
MGIWFERELGSYKLRLKQVLAMEGSMLLLAVGTFVWVGMVVGMALGMVLLACTLVLRKLSHCRYFVRSQDLPLIAHQQLGQIRK